MQIQNLNISQDNDYMCLMGISRENFNYMVSVCKNSESSKLLEVHIAILLVKLRTGLSMSALSTLFKTNKSRISRAIKKATDVVMKDFVPLHLGTFLLIFNFFRKQCRNLKTFNYQ